MAFRPDDPQLSDRERTVLLLAADGLTDKEIARNLGLSLKTVGTYWDRMRQKFSASSRTQVLGQFLRIQVADDQQAGRFDRLFATWEEGVWVIGKEGKTQYANRRVAELFEAPEEDLVGRKAAELVGAANAPKVRKFLAEARTCAHSLEISILGAEGQRWLWLRAAPIQDARPGTTVVLLKDITVRKRVEHALSSCESSLRFLMDHSSDMIALFDEKLAVTYLNESFREVLECEDSEVLGKRVTELEAIFVPADRWAKHLEKALRSGQPQTFVANVDGLKAKLVTHLVPQPSGDFFPQSVIGLIRLGRGTVHKK